MTPEQMRTLNNALMKFKATLDTMGLERTRAHSSVYLQLGVLMGTIARVTNEHADYGDDVCT